MRERGAELRDRLQAARPEMQTLEALLSCNVLEDGGSRATVAPGVTVSERGRDANGERVIAELHDVLCSCRAESVRDGPLERTCDDRCDIEHPIQDQCPDEIGQGDAEQGAGGRIGVQEHPVFVDRDDAAPNVPENVFGLESNEYQLGGGPFLGFLQSRADVATRERNHREHQQLQPNAEIGSGVAQPQDLGEVTHDAQERD